MKWIIAVLLLAAAGFATQGLTTRAPIMFSRMLLSPPLPA